MKRKASVTPCWREEGGEEGVEEYKIRLQRERTGLGGREGGAGLGKRGRGRTGEEREGQDWGRERGAGLGKRGRGRTGEEREGQD